MGLRADAASYAARAGLRIAARAEDGEAVVIDDDSPEARRCRVWGEHWTDHQIPDLPDSTEMAALLAELAIPGGAIAEVVAAREEIAAAVTARQRIRELDADDTLDPDDGQYEDIWRCRQVDDLTPRLAAYARALAHVASFPRAEGAHATEDVGDGSLCG